MPLLGLIGKPVSHSLSPAIFAEFFKTENREWDYQLFPLESISELIPLLEAHPQLVGLNVTIPYKQQVIPLLDSLDSSAANTGAVNTILIQGVANDSKLIGYNTDTFGFEKSLLEWETFTGTQALVLGTGGASKAVQFVLNKLQIPFTLVSRKADVNGIIYADVSKEILATHKLIINTTPIGMEPNIDEKPLLDYSAIGNTHLAYDLVYKPAETAFMKACKANGATTCNGLRMLQLQAEAAWELFKSNTAH